MEDETLTVKEIDRLIECLKANGHSAEDAAWCIKYISGNTQNPYFSQKNKLDSHSCHTEESNS